MAAELRPLPKAKLMFSRCMLTEYTDMAKAPARAAIMPVTRKPMRVKMSSAKMRFHMTQISEKLLREGRIRFLRQKGRFT